MTTTLAHRYTLPGSDRRELRPNGVAQADCPDTEQIDVTIRLKTTNILDMRMVSDWANQQGLTPHFGNSAMRLVKVKGAVKDMEKAFGVKLHVREIPNGGTHRAHYGPASVPLALGGLVSGVFGLDDRPCAKPRIKRGYWRTFNATPDDVEPCWSNTTPSWSNTTPIGPLSIFAFKKPPGTFTPIEVAEAYSFPAGDGEGQTIALIELGGGFRPSDLRAYWAYLGIDGPTVTAVGVNGGKNSVGSEADGEVCLDIDCVGAVAPKANIIVYFSNNTDAGFLDSVSEAIHATPTPCAVSISWGGPESSWTEAAMNAFNTILEDAANLSVTVTVAAGDSGSTDGVDDGSQHVDFPSSSPYSLSCGGTKLVANGSTITSETVWNDGKDGGSGGGGCSTVFDRPVYQPALQCPTKNSVPDIAANADPESGYIVRVDGRYQAVGGTSAVAPMIAGLVARLAQITGKRPGYLNPVLYANSRVCNDVTVGSNGAFSASVGPDCCTGLGSINGTKLLGVLQA